jgi:pimeloyl-ACP methyl ester carboxylesterase
MPNLPSFLSRHGRMSLAPAPEPITESQVVAFDPSSLDTPLVLIHGAWLDGRYWSPVAKQLHGFGFRIHTPTMAGNGWPVPPPHTDYQTIVDLIVAEIENANLWGLYLVAHSFGGVVAQQVAQAAYQRVTGIIFFDAFVAEPGESMLDLQSVSGPDIVDAIRQMRDPKTNAMSWPFPMFRELLMPDATEDYARHIYDAYMHPQPWDVLTEHIDTHLFFSLIARDTPSPVGVPLEVAYIFAPEDQAPAPGFWSEVAMRLGPKCKYIELTRGGHMAMLTQPQMLAEAIRLAVDPTHHSTNLAHRLTAPPPIPVKPVVDATVQSE